MMSGFLDSYLAGIQSGKHDMSTTKCIGESIAETKTARTANNAVEDAATAAAAQMYYTTPQTFPNRMGSLDRHMQMTADQAQRQSSGSSVGYSASTSSGITPPMLCTATPPGGLASGSSQQGSATCASISSSSGAPTPDVLDWTNQMDYIAAGQADSGAQYVNGAQQPQPQHRAAINLLGASDSIEPGWSSGITANMPGFGPQDMDMGAYEGVQHMGMGMGLQDSGPSMPKLGVRSMDLQERDMRNFAWTEDGSQIVWAGQ